MLLGYLMYRSGLVPRRMAMLGLIGGPLVVASGIAVLFGRYTQGSPWSGIATVPDNPSMDRTSSRVGASRPSGSVSASITRTDPWLLLKIVSSTLVPGT